MSNSVHSHLSLMDVFADVIPGTVVLLGLLLAAMQAGVVFPAPDLAGLALGAVFSFVIGMFLQTVAPAVTFAVERAERVPGVPRLGPLDMKKELKAYHDAETKTRMQERFWKLCLERFGFPEQGSPVTEYEDLWRALLAYLESTPYSQTVRMRALAAMTRGLWAGFALLAVVYLSVPTLSALMSVDLVHPALGYEAVAAAVLAAVFWTLNVVFKRLWLKYMMIEFYLDQTMGRMRPEAA